MIKNNVEAAFSDVHRKYERTKQVVVEVKKNEEQLKQFVEEYVGNVCKYLRNDEEWSKMVVEMQSCWALSKAMLWGCLAWSKWVQISS